MPALAVLAWSSVGLVVDFFLSYIILKTFINRKATFTELAFFETIHNSVSFGLAFFLGFSVFSVTGTLDLSVGLLAVWTVASLGLAYFILGLRKVRDAGAFVAVDSAIDYFMGGAFAIPAAASLVAPHIVGPALSSLFSLGPIAMLEGPVILVVVALAQKRLGENPKLVAD